MHLSTYACVGGWGALAVGVGVGAQVRFLWSDVGVSEEDLPRVLQTFPLLFALPLSRMQDVMAFLTEDLAINRKDTAKIIRYLLYEPCSR